MALKSLGLRKTLLWALSSAALAACGSSSDAPASSSDSSVAAAYGALVGDAAQCADKVSTCLEAAGTDQTAWMTCRQDYSACRDAAGAKAEQGLGAAVTVCTAKHRECAKADHDGGNQSCSTELGMCLTAVHHTAAHSDDADAGTDDDAHSGSGSGSGKHDCMDELKTCIEGEKKPGECARSTRQCVVAALPDVETLAPMRGTHHSGSTDGAGGSSAEHMKPEDNSADTDSDDDSATSGEHEDEARMCVKAFASCVDDGDARECASELRTCTEPLTP